MNLGEAAVWMPQTGSPSWGDGRGHNLRQGQSGVGVCLSAKRAQASLAGDRAGPSGYREGGGRASLSKMPFRGFCKLKALDQLRLWLWVDGDASRSQ